MGPTHERLLRRGDISAQPASCAGCCVSAGRPDDVANLNDSSIQTYRYVRAALVGSVVLLFVAVVLQIISDGGDVRYSISAYFYSPVRNVFVGMLVATGVGLVAIKGRPLVEETSLNLAGMMAPVVAFVPTPLRASETSCPPGVTRCIPPEFLPGVENNMAALILIGPPVLAFAWWIAVRRDMAHRSSRLSLSGATILWAGFLIWFFWGPRELFLAGAHYAAATLMFALIIVVVWYNALRTDHVLRVAATSLSYRRIYRAIAGLMSLTLVAALVFFWVNSARPRPGFPLLFVLETVLLGLFTIFWVAQTVEFWREGLPAEADEESAA